MSTPLTDTNNMPQASTRVQDDLHELEMNCKALQDALRGCEEDENIYGQIERQLLQVQREAGRATLARADTLEANFVKQREMFQSGYEQECREAARRRA